LRGITKLAWWEKSQSPPNNIQVNNISIIDLNSFQGKIMKKAFTILSLLLAASAYSQTALPLADAEIRKIDLENKKITLKHGAIKNLDMPAMSMVFQVKDVALLDKLSAGDKVKFTADLIAGSITVMSLEKVK
jgi:Cu/Ag efflux protein CusF